MRIFVGVDTRQPLAWTVLASSIMRRASKPVSLTPLLIHQLPITRKGLTDFTFARYLVPWLCDYKGRALFLDADMLCLADIHELAEHSDDSAVQMVQNIQRFEWPSLMWFNCEKCSELTPQYVQTMPVQNLEWADVGTLPAEWNHCVGYDQPKDDVKIAHFTMGIPEYREVLPCEYAREWFQEKAISHNTCSWLELMGQSVHAPHILAKFTNARAA